MKRPAAHSGRKQGVSGASSASTGELRTVPLPPGRINPSKLAARSLRVGYAIQNVGGIDFTQDVGDTVPIKHSLQGLQTAGHQILCLQLRGQFVFAYKDMALFNGEVVSRQGLSWAGWFRKIERLGRRIQRQLRLPYYAMFDLFRFYETCLRQFRGYAICHEHNGLFCAGGALASKRLGIPYILTFSADPLLERRLVGEPLRGLHYAFAAWIARFTYQHARKIICVSEPAQRHLVDSWGVTAERTVVLANGADCTLFNPHTSPDPAREEFGLGEGPVICFLGGFQPWHGLDILIDSFSQVVEHHPTARLLLIGDGRARNIVDRTIHDTGLEDQVVITGLLPKERVPKVLAAADIAVLPYPKLPKELWFSPLKLYEYMAAGKAIIASDSGQIAAVLSHGQTGLLVEPGSVDALTAAIIRLIENPGERKIFGRNAREQAVARHSWDQYVARLEELYFEVLRDEASDSRPRLAEES